MSCRERSLRVRALPLAIFILHSYSSYPTEVNAGPAAIIKTFLANEAASKWPEDKRNQLADAVIEFERALQIGVRLNQVCIALT